MVFGISTPGPVDPTGKKGDFGYIGDSSAKKSFPVSRLGGTQFVMDDGDIDGADNLIRIRTSLGHQITMSDDGDCFYITHANGQTWMEFGKQGTVDVYSTNSINLRTEGTLNLHADKNINLYAGGTIKMKAQEKMFISSGKTFDLYRLTMGV